MEEKKKNIKFLNLIVMILVILIVAALGIGTAVKVKKNQERVKEYSVQNTVE